MSGWLAKSLDDFEAVDAWIPVRRELGVRAFGVNAWRPEADGTVIAEHDERQSGHEELYVVVEGRATFMVDGDELDAPAGTLVFVRDPAARRKATGEPGTTVFTVGAKPGEAFAPSAWEAGAPAMRAYRAGDYEGALAVFRAAVAEHPDWTTGEYNIACMSALLGRRDDAIEHLRRALERDPGRFAPLEDDDFASLRDDPEFRELARA